MRNKARLSITGSVGENGRVLTPDCPKAVHTGPPLRQSSGLALVSSELPWKPKTSQVPYSSNNENNKIKTIIAPPTKQPETNHKEKTGFTHPTGHLQWARRDRTEAQTITPTVRAHDLLWLSDSSRKSVETRGRTISILFIYLFFFLFFFSNCVVTRRRMFESKGHGNPLEPFNLHNSSDGRGTEGTDTNNIMTKWYRQRPENCKLETQNCAFFCGGGRGEEEEELLWIGKRKKKKKTEPQSRLFLFATQTRAAFKRQQISPDINKRHWEGWSSVPWGEKTFVLILWKMKSIDIEYMSKHRKLWK